MKVPDYVADYRMRLPPSRWNYFSTIRTVEYYKTYWLGIREPGFDRQVFRHMVWTMIFNLSEAPWLSFSNGAGN